MGAAGLTLHVGFWAGVQPGLFVLIASEQPDAAASATHKLAARTLCDRSSTLSTSLS